MPNLSQIRRERMLEFLELLRSKNSDDIKQVRIINEIEQLINEKKYGLVWEEHSEYVDEMLDNNIPVFSEDYNKKISINEEKPYNFILEGDNLHSLRLLEKTHENKIDLIYIDPPYNKGNNDFIYNDRIVDKNDGYSHSKWLSFMSKRLEIARRLLNDNGVIFISIDDKEQSQLKLLCDEIFGEENFIAMYKWNKTSTPPSLSLKVRTKYEYILCYEKRKNGIGYNGGLIVGGDAPLLNRGNPQRIIKFDHNVVKFNFDGELKCGKYDRVELLDNISIVNGYADKDFRISGEFKWTQDTVNKEVDQGTVFLIKTKKLSVRFMRSQKKIKHPSDIISMEECGVGTNETAKNELNQIVPNHQMDYPKPISLIRYLIKFTENNRTNNTILDFFAGSGTTGQAVISLNKDDGGNRKYILCTNNENNICADVTYRRMKNIQDQLPHNLKYFKADFVNKGDDVDNITDELSKHIQPLIELASACDLEKSNYKVFLTEDEFDDYLQNNSLSMNITIFIGEDILMSLDQEMQLKKCKATVIKIPSYYYRNELLDCGDY